MTREDFLSRWSRRKRSDAPEPAVETSVDVPPAPPEQEERSDDEILAELGLTHPDRMAPGDDFGAFLRMAVPRHLRQKALRRLWRTNPTLACLDGLNDYDDDYGAVVTPSGGLKTAYQVGRGIMRQIAAVEPEEKTAEEPERPSEDHAPVASVRTDPGPEEAGQIAEPVPDEATQGPSRRRMVFAPPGRDIPDA